MPKRQRKPSHSDSEDSNKRCRVETTFSLRWLYEPCINPNCSSGVAVEVWLGRLLVDDKRLRGPIPCKSCRIQDWEPTTEQRNELANRGIATHWWDMIRFLDRSPTQPHYYSIVDNLSWLIPPDIEHFNPEIPDIRTSMIVDDTRYYLPEYPHISNQDPINMFPKTELFRRYGAE